MSEATAVQDRSSPTPDPRLPLRRGPGATVRVVGRALPGVREVGAHIERHGAEWDRRSSEALDGGGPLLVALGDSTAQGIGAASAERGYVGQLFARRPLPLDAVRVVNLAVSGARIADVLRDQIPLLEPIRDRAAVITCSVGANDLLRSPDARGCMRRFRTLFAALAGPGEIAIATIPVGPISVSGRVVNAMIRREAPAHGIRVADLQQHLGPPSRRTVAPDRFHPNEEGYRDWAAAFAAALDW